MPDTLQSLMNAVIDGDQARTVELVRKSLEEGVGPLDVFRRGLIPGMEDVGRKMQSGEYFLPEVLISARAMRAASAVLKPM
ncbi:MAG: B12-binding domain-containing protein, partial [Chloroflexi bacterium]|nr:B12-binding domain-containing protein [Chloroflexota bacterium]